MFWPMINASGIGEPRREVDTQPAEEPRPYEVPKEVPAEPKEPVPA